MKKGLTALISIALILAILFAGMAITESSMPKPKTSGFYTDGLHIEYKLQWDIHTYDEKEHKGIGKLTLEVRNDNIIINMSLPNYFPSGEPLYREKVFNVSGNNVYYKGERVILPFFYGGGKIVSYYMGDSKDIVVKGSVKVTGRQDQLNTLQGGIIQFQSVYYLYTESDVYFPNGTIWNKGLPMTYEYGKNTNLLFFLDCSIGNDPIINGILNLTYPDKDNAGNIFYIPVEFGLSLHKTNIDLGPVDYFSLVLTFLVIGLPVIILVGIPAAIVYIYIYLKNKRNVRKDEEDNRGE